MFWPPGPLKHYSVLSSTSRARGANFKREICNKRLINAQNYMINVTGQGPTQALSNILHTKFSERARRRAWKRSLRHQAFPKTVSICDNLI